jgi:hypothetical protein
LFITDEQDRIYLSSLPELELEAIFAKHFERWKNVADMNKAMQHAERLDQEAQNLQHAARADEISATGASTATVNAAATSTAASVAATSTAASAVVTSTHKAALGQLDDFYDSLMDFEMDDIENQPGNDIDGTLGVPGEEDKCDELDADKGADEANVDEADLDGEDDPDVEEDSPVVVKNTKVSNKIKKNPPQDHC